MYAPRYSRILTFVFALCTTLLSSAASASDVSNRARTLIQQANFAEAVRTLEPAARTGDKDAQFELGLLYYNGKGVPENEKRAVELLTASANAGHVDAMYQLGNAFTFGKDTPRLVADTDIAAAEWYYKAAKKGSADAQYSLGLLFMAGKGVERNDKEASYWMQEAAKGGHKDAKNYVATRK